MNPDKPVTNRRKDGTFGANNNANPSGRPVGLTVVGKLKQMFEENPADFEAFVLRYKENPNNERHLTEMIDGRPKQDLAVDAEVHSTIELSDEQLERIIRKRAEQLTG